jgi:hypothetical protein
MQKGMKAGDSPDFEMPVRFYLPGLGHFHTTKINIAEHFALRVECPDGMGFAPILLETVTLSSTKLIN